jgi:polyhydroxyalkanoate synthase
LIGPFQSSAAGTGPAGAAATAPFALPTPPGPLQPWQAFAQWAAASPEFALLYTKYLGDLATVWTRTLEREQGRQVDPVAAPSAGDRRFAAPEWSSNVYFDYLKQTYLIGSRFLEQAVDAATLDEHLKGQLKFYVRQYVDSLAPSNFAATNPDALKAALATSGETLKRGVLNLVEDIGKGRISTVDEQAFEVGRNLATTPGAVVFENALIQLIQYAPSTPTVHRRPLLMVPPCINKFYILDLSPDNSFVRYAVEQGHTVFMVSWRNPDESLGHLRWDDYVEDGVIAAMEVVRAICGDERMNVLGFCVGGTLASTALAVLAARGQKWVESLTLLATLLDFSDTGEIGCFVDEESVVGREAALGKGGLLSGRELSLVFSALRDNDLIWSYVVNNYLKGERPAAFDILYWNADSTNLPGPMYAWYLRNMYLENRLRVPGGVTVCGEKVDLGKVAAPAYVLATREDHIVPWRSAYASTGLVGRDVRFVLGASGHVAGIVNPAAKNRRSWWAANGKPPAAPDAWLAAATEHPGSWWTDWAAWLAPHGGPKRKAPPRPGNADLQPIEPAPGRYVKHRIV